MTNSGAVSASWASRRPYKPGKPPRRQVRCPPSGRGAEAFQKGVQALAQYTEREGGGVPGRAHVEQFPDGTEHRTGVWIANQRARRDRLDADQLRALTELGVQWATV
ncbi:helicase associated domain-containing protein [Streptomyces sp. NPDC059874]|uniref:helicase associated domain-containing protein n=1 Tax=Streptomyces sp. NPDC059874 TaxID=3346983 RepID=UPI003649A7C7